MLWIIADDANYAVATNHFAVTANLLNRSTNFHDINSVDGRAVVQSAYGLRN